MQDLASRLAEEVARSGARRVLVVGARWPGASAPAGVELVHIAEPDALLALPPPSERFPLALLLDVLADPLPVQAGAVVARLRDLHAQRLFATLALAPEAAPEAARTTMRALGLEPRGKALHRGRVMLLLGFDLYRYKPAPDWLNPRHWANPDLWGKFRW